MYTIQVDRNSQCNPRKPRALIFDLDGVIVDSADRIRTRINHAAKLLGDYETYYKSIAEDYSVNLDGDVPIPLGIQLIQGLINSLNIDRFFASTMRGEEGRSHTLRWLQDHLPFHLCSEDLLMSSTLCVGSDGTYTESRIAKLGSIDHKRAVTINLMREYDVVIAIDDHPGICAMYREIGVPSLCPLFPSIDCLTPNGDQNCK